MFADFLMGLFTDTQRQNDEHESQLHIFSDSIQEKQNALFRQVYYFILINGRMAGL